MVLQYPKLSDTAAVAHFSDYKKRHQNFMQLYKRLYEDVAVFALLPEKFVHEAEPIIDNYLNDYSGNRTEEGKAQLQEITDFISLFYEFMNEATEMFVEHQALSEQTFEYLEKTALIGKRNDGKKLSQYEDEYVQLIPLLEALKDSLYRVRFIVDSAGDDLERLMPLWASISKKVRAKMP